MRLLFKMKHVVSHLYVVGIMPYIHLRLDSRNEPKFSIAAPR